jgi:hypothetical protein
MMSYKSKYKQARGVEDLKVNKPMLSWKRDKKMVVLAGKGDKTRVVHFGQIGYDDYTMHHDKKRRANYLRRSAGIRDGHGRLTKNDPFSANYWARRILW